MVKSAFIIYQKIQMYRESPAVAPALSERDIASPAADDEGISPQGRRGEDNLTPALAYAEEAVWIDHTLSDQLRS